MRRLMLLLAALVASAQTPPSNSVILSCACSGNGGSGGTVHYGIGKLSARPSCTKDSVGVWFSEDQPEGLQISTCSNISGAYRWVTPGTPGASGALVVAEGVTDISNAIVPRMNAANAFTGQNSFGGLQLLPKKYADLPVCSTATEGLHRWITDAHTSAWGDHVAVGGGANHVGVACNGTAWSVYAK